MKYTNSNITKQKLPSLSDVEQSKADLFLKNVQDIIEEGKLTKYLKMIDSLADEYYIADIAAALLKIVLGDAEKKEEAAVIDEYAPDDEFVEANRGKFVTVHINAGKKKGIRAKDIVGAFSGESGIPGSMIGEIDLFDTYILADVPAEYLKDLFKGMKDKRIKGTKIKLKIADEEK